MLSKIPPLPKLAVWAFGAPRRMVGPRHRCRLLCQQWGGQGVCGLKELQCSSHRSMSTCASSPPLRSSSPCRARPRAAELVHDLFRRMSLPAQCLDPPDSGRSPRFRLDWVQEEKSVAAELPQQHLLGWQPHRPSLRVMKLRPRQLGRTPPRTVPGDASAITPLGPTPRHRPA